MFTTSPTQLPTQEQVATAAQKAPTVSRESGLQTISSTTSPTQLPTQEQVATAAQKAPTVSRESGLQTTTPTPAPAQAAALTQVFRGRPAADDIMGCTIS